MRIRTMHPEFTAEIKPPRREERNAAEPQPTRQNHGWTESCKERRSLSQCEGFCPAMILSLGFTATPQIFSQPANNFDYCSTERNLRLKKSCSKCAILTICTAKSAEKTARQRALRPLTFRRGLAVAAFVSARWHRSACVPVLEAVGARAARCLRAPENAGAPGERL